MVRGQGRRPLPPRCRPLAIGHPEWVGMHREDIGIGMGGVERFGAERQPMPRLSDGGRFGQQVMAAWRAHVGNPTEVAEAARLQSIFQHVELWTEAETVSAVHETLLSIGKRCW